ncbi:MAG: hypothetical protein ACM3U1_01835 [Chloroflexota bacterium]
MEGIRYPNLDVSFVEKLENYLASIDYNEAYITHFLENVNEAPKPFEYVLFKFPDFEEYVPSINAKKSEL